MRRMKSAFRIDTSTTFLDRLLSEGLEKIIA